MRRHIGAEAVGTACRALLATRLARACAIRLGGDLAEDRDIYKPTVSRYAYLMIVEALALAVAWEISTEATEDLRRIRVSLTAYHGRIGPQPLGD